MEKIYIGNSEKGEKVYLDPSSLTRHGLITGSTGSGKTTTVKVLIEELNKRNISTFVSDIKGDLSSLMEEGDSSTVEERLENLKITDYKPESFKVNFLDLFGKMGLDVNTSVTDFGPYMLKVLLELNQTQEEIMVQAIKFADENGIKILDFDDLKALFEYFRDNIKELKEKYGLLNPQSIGKILRSIDALEEKGLRDFFKEPAFDINDLFSEDGRINILYSKELYKYPSIYTAINLFFLSSIYNKLEEVDFENYPKMVFFFDEAHLIFKGANPYMIDEIEKIVRLIRSKGVGIFFITQYVEDIPEKILSNLSSKIIHSLRAYTPNEIKEVKALANSIRQEEGIDYEEAILNLKKGEATVSFLEEDFVPSTAKKVLIKPPLSKLGPVNENKVSESVNSSNLYNKYQIDQNSYSFYEFYIEDAEKRKEFEKEIELQKQKEMSEKKEAKERKKAMSPFTKMLNSMLYSIGREAGKSIYRGIFGTRKR